MAEKRRKSRKGKVSRYARCVGAKLRGRKFPGKMAQRKALRAAARACKKK